MLFSRGFFIQIASKGKIKFINVDISNEKQVEKISKCIENNTQEER
jgi:hypothetical protein